MTNHNQWPRKFSEALFEIEHEETWQHAYYIIKDWLIESLEPKQKRVHEYVAEYVKEVSCYQVSMDLGMSYNHTATILKTLVDLKLLKRRMYIGRHIRFYMYWK